MPDDSDQFLLTPDMLLGSDMFSLNICKALNIRTCNTYNNLHSVEKNRMHAEVFEAFRESEDDSLLQDVVDYVSGKHDTVPQSMMELFEKTRDELAKNIDGEIDQKKIKKIDGTEFFNSFKEIACEDIEKFSLTAGACYPSSLSLSGNDYALSDVLNMKGEELEQFVSDLKNNKKHAKNSGYILEVPRDIDKITLESYIRTAAILQEDGVAGVYRLRNQQRDALIIHPEAEVDGMFPSDKSKAVCEAFFKRFDAIVNERKGTSRRAFLKRTAQVAGGLGVLYGVNEVGDKLAPTGLEPSTYIDPDDGVERNAETLEPLPSKER